MDSHGKHRLAAIMFTDLVGYSDLSHRHEALAMELLNEHRRITREIIRANHGNEIKTVGDAFLVKFDSAVDAVQGAIRIQRAHFERNEAAEGVPIEVRIGIHLGDVIVSEGDVYGDGVNIASRLQGIAKAGRITVSAAVYQQVRNKIECAKQSLGLIKLKNIASPVKVFELLPVASDSTGLFTLRRVARIGARSRTRLLQVMGFAVVAMAMSMGVFYFFNAPQARKAGLDQERHRLAVLPFKLIGGVEADEYLPEGLTEELIHRLSRNSKLQVLSRQTVLPYRSTMKSIREIGHELDVGVLVVGSVQKNDKLLRITVQLSDVKSQTNLWSQDLETDLTGLFAAQKQLADSVAARLVGGVKPSQDEAKNYVPDQKAYDLFLKGRYFMNRRTIADLKRAEDLLLESVEKDSGFVAALSSLAMVYDLQGFYGATAPRIAAKKIEEYAFRALALDPNASEALIALAEARAYIDYRWAEAEELFKRAIAADPGNPLPRQWLSEFYEAVGRFSEAEREVNVALELDRFSLTARTAAGHIQFYAGRIERAEAYLSAVVDIDPGFMVARYWLARVLLVQGRRDEARREAERAVDLSRRSSMPLGILGHILAVSGDKEAATKILNELQARTKTEYVSAYDLALIYVGLQDYGQALKAIADAIENRLVLSVFIKNDPLFAPLRGHPDFGMLIKRIGI